LTAFLSKKHYLHATRLLVTSLDTAEGTLKEVEALRDVRAELQIKKEVCIIITGP
jgi:exocyst complex component 4